MSYYSEPARVLLGGVDGSVIRSEVMTRGEAIKVAAQFFGIFRHSTIRIESA